MTANHLSADRTTCPRAFRAYRVRIRLRARVTLAVVACVAWICGAPAVSWAQTPVPSQDAAEVQDAGAPPPPDTGYLPGDRRALGLGLSPHAPEVPALP